MNRLIKLIVISVDMEDMAIQKYREQILNGRILLEVDKTLPEGSIINKFTFNKPTELPTREKVKHFKSNEILTGQVREIVL